MTNKNDSWLNIIIKTIIVTVLVIISLNLYGNFKTSNSNSSYYETKRTIERMENSEPQNFLLVSGNFSENFWGTKIKISGEIKNSATMASYKDAMIRVTYYSKTKTVLTHKDYMIYEVFMASSIVKFKLEIKNYKNVKSIGLKVINASIN